jgi:ubiquinone/menaquinone biosynthesis C-methylase UbiE
MTSGQQVFRHNIANYDTAWSVQEYTREPGLRRVESELMNLYFPGAPAIVLDLGCGAGRTTGALARKGYRPIAIDLSAALIEQARRRYPELDFRLMDATRLEFPDASFDAALFSYNGIDCIYPASERVRCIEETLRVLKPGGTFLLSSHNLIGAVFSGGYHYLRGYWNAMKLLVSQWRNPLAAEWYIKYTDGGGDQYLFSAPPAHTVRQLTRAGFEVLDVCGGDMQRDRTSLLMRHQHVHFVARKPG